MYIKLRLGLLALILTSCTNNRQNTFAQTTTAKKLTVDTIIGSKNITDEIAGSAYRKRATGYFVITDKDTSKYTCIFVELKDSGKVCIDMNIPYYKDSITYRERMKMLERILPIAAKDFNFDLLTSIYIGRLVQNGDLAIDITNQYKQKFITTNRIKTSDYPKVAKFLKQSKLFVDLNELLKPYSILADKVFPEHLFFTSKKELYLMSNVEADTTKVPERILDCMTVIWLKKNK